MAKGPWWEQQKKSGGYGLPKVQGRKIQFYRYQEFVPTETATFSGLPQGFHYFGTATIPSQLEAETIRYDNWLEAVKPPRSKREPKHRFLKDKDISKLMDKYFNVKETSI